MPSYIIGVFENMDELTKEIFVCGRDDKIEACNSNKNTLPVGRILSKTGYCTA